MRSSLLKRSFIWKVVVVGFSLFFVAFGALEVIKGNTEMGLRMMAHTGPAWMISFFLLNFIIALMVRHHCLGVSGPTPEEGKSFFRLLLITPFVKRNNRVTKE